MHCTNCGTSIPENTKFCSSCGSEVNVQLSNTEEGSTLQVNKNDMLVGIGLVVLALPIWWLWFSFNTGMDVEVAYCEHSIRDCKWDENVWNVANCTFTNEANVPTKLSNFKTW